MQTLAMALVMQDRTRSGSLPFSLVVQFLKLHGVYPARTDAQWNELLQKHQSGGLTRRVQYEALLAEL